MAEKKKRKWLKVLIIVGICVFTYAILVAIVGAMFERKVEVEPGTILEIDLSGVVTEGPRDELLAFTSGDTVSIFDTLAALRAAAKDERIAGVRVLLQSSDIGWGAAEDLLGGLDAFRESGKPVYVLYQQDMIEDLNYFIATGGDRIWISPETGVMINGLASEVTFWRGSLEKLYIEPEVIMFKEYKSAGEPFVNKEMSPHMREATTKLLEAIDTRFKERVVERRKVTTEAVQDLLNLGVATTAELESRGFVDRLGYLDELEAEFESLDGVKEYKGVGPDDYLFSLGSSDVDGPAIAILFAEGPIVSQESGGFLDQLGEVICGPELAANIRAAVDDEKVEAIVIRVNSPGGSAVGSDLVTREIDRARGKGKPVIVSMSDVAASGGYWIAMHANRIVAQHTTVTGSIGVVFMKFNVTGFMEWIGANVETVSTAPYADILGYAPFDEERKQRVMTWMDDIYNSFVEKVADGRKMDPTEVEKLARGRVWSGADALKIGLIDKLGGLDEAFQLAKSEAGLDTSKKYPVIVYPRAKPLIEQLLDGSLIAGAPKLPAKADMMRAVTDMARPQVLVKAPDIHIH